MVERPGKEYYTGGVFREIVRDERLVFAWSAVGGWPELDPERLDNSPLVTVTSSDAGERGTEMVDVTLPAHPSQDEVERWHSLGIRDGWQDTIDRLAPSL
jgi:uncharacterized protein YndB with AHSA1/START domain